MSQALPWLSQLVAGLSPRRPGLNPGSVNVGFVVDKVALRQVFHRVLRFSPVNFIPPVLQYLTIAHKINNGRSAWVTVVPTLPYSIDNVTVMYTQILQL
jgi:hypothetical protein